MVATDASTRLQREFEAEPGTFLLQMRCDLTWDDVAFDRLVAAMHDFVRQRDAEAEIPRWIAEGFWYLDFAVREWTSHENFPRHREPIYYEQAYGRLHDLAYWLFMGESPYEDGKGFDPL